LKPEQWGSLLVQENNQEGKACDKRRIIIIIIIPVERKFCVQVASCKLQVAVKLFVSGAKAKFEPANGAAAANGPVPGYILVCPSDLQHSKAPFLHRA
jgi:hypothetical protein